jgi:hypothetical protein
MRMPREEGPNAERRAEKGKLPASRSLSETETNYIMLEPM